MFKPLLHQDDVIIQPRILLPHLNIPTVTDWWGRSHISSHTRKTGSRHFSPGLALAREADRWAWDTQASHAGATLARRPMGQSAATGGARERSGRRGWAGSS